MDERSSDLAAERRARLDLVLEEYRSIRAEILQAQSAQQSTLRFGVATLAIVVSATANIGDDLADLRRLVLAVGIPATCFLVLLIWYGEVLRMLRAGLFIRRRETYIKDLIGEPVLYWEDWAHANEEKPSSSEKRAHDTRTTRFIDIERHYFYVVVGAFGVVAVGALLLSNFRREAAAAGGMTWEWDPVLILTVVGTVLTLIYAGILVLFYRHGLDIRRDYEREPRVRP